MELHERGQNLSVGQRQLIAFARAVVAEPRILVLDEATANVDTHTERTIQQALQVLLAGRTSFRDSRTASPRFATPIGSS